MDRIFIFDVDGTLTPSRRTEKGGSEVIREKEPYKEIPIRLKGTNKTTKANHKEKEWGRKQIQKHVYK